jgi:hypothetical protein
MKADSYQEKIYVVCDELGYVLTEHYNKEDAMENCNWAAGQTFTFNVVTRTKPTLCDTMQECGVHKFYEVCDCNQ